MKIFAVLFISSSLLASANLMAAPATNAESATPAQKSGVNSGALPETAPTATTTEKTPTTAPQDLSAPKNDQKSTPFSKSFLNPPALLLQKQRTDYQKIQQLISTPTPTSLALAHSLQQQLGDYPLADYAQFAILNADPNLSLEQIQQFAQQNALPALTDKLKNQWLNQQFSQQNWQVILTNRSALPNGLSAQCILATAEQKAEQLQAEKAEIAQTIVNKLTQETDAAPQQSPAKTIPQWAQKAEKLWLTGASLPSQCDELFSQWAMQGYQTNAQIQQRALLALEQKNIPLINHLAQQTKEQELRTWLMNLAKFAEKPTFNQPDSPFAIDKLSAENPDDKRILLALFPTFVKTLDDKNISNEQDPFATYTDWAARFQLSAEQQKQWQKAFISQIFDSPQAAVQQWRDKQLTTFNDDALLERRIRLAIREKQDFAPWLAKLSPKTAAKEEWQYWTAKAAERQGNTQQAKALLNQLAKQRHFYGILAAQELELDYQPAIQQLTPNPQLLADKTSQAAFARIAELRYWQQPQNALQEWLNLLNEADFEHKLQLSAFAAEQQWFDLAVEATIQAKAWGYLALRLPNAYADWFALNLADKQISQSFAMAIARQESAWRPYVTSPANAFGLMQLLASTAKQTASEFELPYKDQKQLFDPFDNIMLGTAHLQQLYNKYGNNRILIAAAYNAGAARVDKWLERANGQLSLAEFVASIPYFETRGYVQNVLAYDAYYQMLQHKKVQKFSQEEYNRAY